MPLVFSKTKNDVESEYPFSVKGFVRDLEIPIVGNDDVIKLISEQFTSILNTRGIYLINQIKPGHAHVRNYIKQYIDKVYGSRKNLPSGFEDKCVTDISNIHVGQLQVLIMHLVYWGICNSIFDYNPESGELDLSIGKIEDWVPDDEYWNALEFPEPEFESQFKSMIVNPWEAIDFTSQRANIRTLPVENMIGIVHMLANVSLEDYNHEIEEIDKLPRRERIVKTRELEETNFWFVLNKYATVFAEILGERLSRNNFRNRN